LTSNPCITRCFVFSLETRNDGLSETLLDWPTVSQKFAWNIIFLLGAGFAMAKAAKVYIYIYIFKIFIACRSLF
jgi:hypothetical protein